VGVIGSSNNPIPADAFDLIIAALLMVSLGVSGPSGVAVVLGVAAVVCVSSAVAGELMQDFKAGYILGGTPRSIQIVELIAVVLASVVMYFPLYILQVGNVKSGGTGFGDPKLAAPQAGLMAALAQGIVGGEMAWPLVVTGAIFGVVLIMFKVRSPMLVAVACTAVPHYLRDFRRRSAALDHRLAQPRGAEQRGAVDACRERGHPDRQRIDRRRGAHRLAVRYFKFKDIAVLEIFKDPSYLVGFVVLLIMGFAMVRVPLANAGRPEDPAPPSAMM
jgi:hypothetical protein